MRALEDLVARNVAMRSVGSEIVQGSRNGLLAAGAFMLLAGAVFLVVGLQAARGTAFGVSLGALFVLYGTYQVVRALRIPRAAAKKGA